VSYRVLLRPAAQRDLRHLPRVAQERIITALEALQDDPRPRGTADLAGDLKGLRKLRVGRYRAAYEVDEENSCIRVWGTGHRRSFYDRLRRRE
jgi:mRNA interferase RelE/StbE